MRKEAETRGERGEASTPAEPGAAAEFSSQQFSIVPEFSIVPRLLPPHPPQRRPQWDPEAHMGPWVPTVGPMGPHLGCMRAELGIRRTYERSLRTLGPDSIVWKSVDGINYLLNISIG